MSQVSFSSITSSLAVGGTRTINVGGRTETRKIAIPSHSAAPQIYLPQHRLLNAVSNPAMFGNTSKQTIQIERGDIASIKDMHLKLVITVSGAPVVLAAVPHWFSQIDLRTSSDNNLVATMYSDTMMANLCTVVPIGKQQAVFDALNIESGSLGYLGNTSALAPGQYTFYLPLFANSVIGNFAGLNMTGSTSALNFDFTPANPIVSGAGTISLQSLGFLIESAKLESQDEKQYLDQYSMYITENLFLDPVVTSFTSKQLTAGGVNLFNLLPVVGLCSHQLVIIRPQGSINNNVGNASFNWLNVGDEGAAFDLVTANNTSLWGNGNPVGCKFMRSHIAADQSDNNFIATKPCYYINYCASIRGSFMGQIKGAHMFSGDNESIALTLPIAPIKEIQTVTFSAIPSSNGSYRFLYRGELSASIPASATPAAMAAALQGLRSFAAQFITVVVSASATAGLSFTLTFTHPATAGLEGEIVSVVTDSLGAVAATARTLAGTAGLSSGLYDVLIYSYIFRTGSYVNGKLRSDLYLGGANQRQLR